MTPTVLSPVVPAQTSDVSKTVQTPPADYTAPVEQRDTESQAGQRVAEMLRRAIQEVSTDTSEKSRVPLGETASRTDSPTSVGRAVAVPPVQEQEAGDEEASRRVVAEESSAIADAPAGAKALPAVQVASGPGERESLSPAATAVSARAQELDVLMSQQGGQSADGSRDEAAHRESSASRLMATVQVAVSGPAAPAFASLAAASVDQAQRPADEDVARQIVQAVHLQWRNGIGDARLTLQPEYLGEVVISLRVEGGAVTATVHAAEPEVRAWMQAHEPLLKQGLANQGLVLDQLSVTDEREDRGDAREGSRQSPEQPPYRRKTPRGPTDVFELEV
jgi:flagellar hook-length control protein FliK